MDKLAATTPTMEHESLKFLREPDKLHGIGG
jgi:hypothetical protein